MKNLIAASFAVSGTVAWEIATWVLYLYKLSAWKRALVCVGAGVVAVVVGMLLSIGIDYLVRKYVSKTKLSNW